MTAATREEMEQLLRQLRGVASVSVSGSGPETRVHVLGAPERSDRQLLRDVRSALIAQLGLTLSPERIQVVPLPGESLGNLRPTRPEIVSVEVHCTGGVHVARVTLAYKERLVEGESRSDIDVGRLKLVAEATIAAVHQALNQHSVFHIEHVTRQQLGERELVLTAIEFRTQRFNRQLLGVSYISGSQHQAAAQAVLDAVNRQFELPEG